MKAPKIYDTPAGLTPKEKYRYHQKKAAMAWSGTALMGVIATAVLHPGSRQQIALQATGRAHTSAARKGKPMDNYDILHTFHKYDDNMKWGVAPGLVGATIGSGLRGGIHANKAHKLKKAYKLSESRKHGGAKPIKAFAAKHSRSTAHAPDVAYSYREQGNTQSKSYYYRRQNNKQIRVRKGKRK